MHRMAERRLVRCGLGAGVDGRELGVLRPAGNQPPAERHKLPTVFAETDGGDGLRRGNVVTGRDLDGAGQIEQVGAGGAG
jgi:hypothetical protein